MSLSKKLRLYLETSVVSYLTAKPSRDLIVSAHQQITSEWWESAQPHYDVYISSVVLDEASKGDPLAASRRLERIRTFPLLEVKEDIHILAEKYFSEIPLPEKARADAYHLAIAAWHGMDFLVSWNCKHIVNGHIRLLVEEINDRQGIRTPIICTPEELLEE